MTFPRYFKDLGKACSDLFEPKGKDYDLKQPTILFKANVAKPKSEIRVKFENDGAIIGEVSDKITTEYGTVKCTLNTKKDPSLEFENKSWVEGLELKMKTSAISFTKMSANYRRDWAALSVDVENYDVGEIRLKPTAVFSYDPVSIGASAEINPLAEKDYVPDYNIGFEYANESKDLVLTMKTKDKANTICGFLSYNINKRAMLGVGYTGGFRRDNFIQTLLVGGTYKFDENLHFKGKLANSGQANLLFTQKLSPQISLAFSSQFDIRDVQKDSQKLGIKLTLGE